MDDVTQHRIAELVRRGWGWEDIACDLKLTRAQAEQVRAIVMQSGRIGQDGKGMEGNGREWKGRKGQDRSGSERIGVDRQEWTAADCSGREGNGKAGKDRKGVEGRG